MRVHYLTAQPLKKGKAPRATIGGAPVVASGQKWPHCRLCKAPMVFFLQFDLQKAFDLPLKSNSHLLIFMCPQHNDIPTQLHSTDGSGERLPERYWEKTFGHYSILLNKPGKEEVLIEDEHLAPREVVFTAAEEDIDWDGFIERGTPGFKVGGVPLWGAEASYATCACGAEMIHLLQVPKHQSFLARNDAPVQPDAVATGEYNLFLGRPTFIFACKQQCTPNSLIALTQDSDDEMLAETA